MHYKLVKAVIKVSRTGNLLIIALTQLLASAFLISGETMASSLMNKRLWLLMFSTAAIAAAGNIINDYYDIKIDLINKPEKVVVGKDLKRRKAMALHTLFNIMGIAIGALLSWKIALVNLTSAFALWYYSNQLKRKAFIGNVVVAALTGMSIWIVGLLYSKFSMLLLLYTLFAFFFNLIREIVKDIVDMSGDKTFGCTTLPIIWGIRKTKRFMLWVTGVYYLTLLGLTAWYQDIQIMAFTSLLILPVGFIFYFLLKADTRKKFRKITVYTKIIMLLGVLSMALWI